MFYTKKGFTTMEILVVLAVLSFIVAITFSSLSDFRNKSALKSSTQTALSVLQNARQKTLSSENLSQYGVHIDNSDLTLFTGSSYSQGLSSNIVYSIDSNIEVTYSLNGGGSDIVFDRLTGQTSNYGTITFSLSSDNTKYKTITINNMGSVYEE